jgi:hypothetical protein
MLSTKSASKKTPPSRSRATVRPRTRRTTLTLPAELVNKAERLAKQQRQTLSAAIAGLMEQSLRGYSLQPAGNSNALESLRKAFAPFTDEEMLLLDGVSMDEPVGENE